MNKLRFTILIKDQLGNVSVFPIRFTDREQAIKRAESLAAENFCMTQVEKTELVWPQQDIDGPPVDWEGAWNQNEAGIPPLWIRKLKDLEKRITLQEAAEPKADQ